MPKQKTRSKRKERKVIPSGRMYISASFNNTIVTATDGEGNVLCWASAGTAGFKGARKGTPYAAQMAANITGRKARDDFGMRQVEICVKGPGSGREAALRSVASAGFHIISIRDITPIAHGGCRPPKKRRV
jgi:small subunit ribosomal protein S11